MWTYNDFIVYILPVLMFILLIAIAVKAKREYQKSDPNQKRKKTKQLIISSFLTLVFISGFVYYLTHTI